MLYKISIYIDTFHIYVNKLVFSLQDKDDFKTLNSFM